MLSRVSVLADCSRQSIHCDISILGPRNIATSALLDSGAGDVFIDNAFARKHGFQLKPLLCPIPVFNVDHTPNKDGQITHYTWLDLDIKGTKIPTRVYASNLGGESIILGFPWLQRVNPAINFRTGDMHINPDDIQPEPSLLRTLRMERLARRRQVTMIELPKEPTIATINPTLDGAILCEPITPTTSYDPPEPVNTDLPESDTDLLISFLNNEPLTTFLAPSDAPALRDTIPSPSRLPGPAIG